MGQDGQGGQGGQDGQDGQDGQSGQDDGYEGQGPEDQEQGTSGDREPSNQDVDPDQDDGQDAADEMLAGIANLDEDQTKATSEQFPVKNPCIDLDNRNAEGYSSNQTPQLKLKGGIWPVTFYVGRPKTHLNLCFENKVCNCYAFLLFQLLNCTFTVFAQLQVFK